MAVHLPKGTRDFLPEQMQNRRYVIDIIRGIFESYGFASIETPAFERIETLTGKYSGDTDKLMFRIHKRGRHAKPGECDLALRYDLTVPLARVMAMHPEIRLPFKRYQIQPVWRADRPQKGRFREFYQCDIDILGTQSSQADAECVAIVSECLSALGFREYTIRINDRRILSDFAAAAGARTPQDELSVLIAIDKLDKIGREKVADEIRERGFEPEALEPLWSIVEQGGSTEDRLNSLVPLLTERGQKGVEDLRALLNGLDAMGVASNRIEVDPSLARGADYYTGPVFEAVVEEPAIGTLAGGGRYDDLIGTLSGRSVPAVGVSLGLERLLVVMEELGMLPKHSAPAELLVTVFDEERQQASTRFAHTLRVAGIRTELYLGESRLKSQFKYANARGFRWLAVIGPEEDQDGTVSLKNLSTGDKYTLQRDQAAQTILKAPAI